MKKNLFSLQISPDLKAFVTQAPVPMALTDVTDNYRFLVANKSYEKYLQRKVLGKTIEEVFGVTEIKKNLAFALYFNVRKSKKPITYEALPVSLNGQLTYLDSYHYPLINPQGRVTHIVSLLIDVTEKVKHAENLRIERDLRDAFLSHLSHDLNQPLYIAKTSFETIEKITKMADVKKLAAHGKTGIKRTESMIKNLLDAYYIDAKKKEALKIEEFEPCEIARTLIDVLRFTYGERFVLKEKQFCVRWDREAFTRILDNLLSNAVKYSPKGTPITVTFEKTPSKIIMIVHNQGSFISPEDKETIFRMYEKGTSGKGKEGWGIGLSIVKKLAEAHGGTVSVESSKKTGTSFIVGIPRKLKPKS